MFPACEAVIVHRPTATVVTVEFATVHTEVVSEVNDTGSPDDADADKVTGAPIVTSGGCPNVIVCAAWLTWNDSVAWASESSEAVIVHRPAATVVTVEFATVHTEVVSEVNDTGSLEDEDADTVTVAPTIWLVTGSKVIVSAATTTLADAVSQAFCAFADGLVSWRTPPAKLAGQPITVARRLIPRNLHSQDRNPTRSTNTFPPRYVRSGTLRGSGWFVSMTTLLTPEQKIPRGCYSAMKSEAPTRREILPLSLNPPRKFR